MGEGRAGPRAKQNHRRARRRRLRLGRSANPLAGSKAERMGSVSCSNARRAASQRIRPRTVPVRVRLRGLANLTRRAGGYGLPGGPPAGLGAGGEVVGVAAGVGLGASGPDLPAGGADVGESLDGSAGFPSGPPMATGTGLTFF